MNGGLQLRNSCVGYAIVLVGLGLVLSGCGAGKTLVLKPAEANVKVFSVEVMEGASTVALPEDAHKAFRQYLENALYSEAAFQRGPGLKISYRFIQYDPGSQAARWVSGGIGNAGEGSVTVEAKYLRPSGEELATIQAEGKIGSGFFGGSFDLAMQKAAEKIGEYTKQNFR